MYYVCDKDQMSAWAHSLCHTVLWSLCTSGVWCMMCKCPIAIYKTGLVLTCIICASIVKWNPSPSCKVIIIYLSFMISYCIIHATIFLQPLQESLLIKEWNLKSYELWEYIQTNHQAFVVTDCLRKSCITHHHGFFFQPWNSRWHSGNSNGPYSHINCKSERSLQGSLIKWPQCTLLNEFGTLCCIRIK